MKCSKDHVEIQWDEKKLFCCPVCLGEQVHNRQRQVIANLSKALEASQSNIEFFLKNQFGARYLTAGYNNAKAIIEATKNGF